MLSAPHCSGLGIQIIGNHFTFSLCAFLSFLDTIVTVLISNCDNSVIQTLRVNVMIIVIMDLSNRWNLDFGPIFGTAVPSVFFLCKIILGDLVTWSFNYVGFRRNFSHKVPRNDLRNRW